jgi:hypothetical protein
MPKPVSRESSQACRRAAALFTHWRRDDNEGVLAVLRETEHGTDPEIIRLVCGLLDVGASLIQAAREGAEDDYLAYVLREAALDETGARHA